MRFLPSLTLLGASVRAAAYSAVRAGYVPYSIDLFADRDLADVGPVVKIAAYPAGFLGALTAAPPAPWIYTGGLENHPRLIDRLAAVRPLLGNHGNVLRKVRDPIQIARIAGEAGCCFPPTRCRSSAVGGADERSDASPSQWLVKPLRSSGGVAIRLATAQDVARPPRGTYLQRYIEGDSVSAVFVAAGGRAVLVGLTRQLLGRDFGLPRPFLYVGSVGPISLSANDRGRVEAFGNTLAERSGLTGLFNVDLVRNGAGLWPLEVNPRYSASVEVLERAGGFSFVELHIHACERGQLPADVAMKTSRRAGKAVVYAAADCVVPKSLDDLVNDWNANSQWPAIADLPRVDERLRCGQPIVTVFADGDALDAVAAELRRRVATVERLLADS